jgi:prepilin-type N-terminal cleavage/methylation domain-containing protein
MKPYRKRQVGARCQRGFTLVEVMFGMMIFTMMVLIFSAVFPFALRTAEFSNNYSQAALLAQHKIDELQTAGFSRLDYTDLNGLGIIDSSPNTSPYSFTTVDNLDGGGSNHGYFPAGSTGTITIVDYHTLNSGVPAGKMDYATINIRWTSYTGSVGTYSASSLL